MLFEMLRLPRAAIVPWGDDGDDAVVVDDDGWCVRDVGRDDRVVEELEAVLFWVEAVGCCWVSVSCKGCKGVEGEGNWFCEFRRRGCDN